MATVGTSFLKENWTTTEQVHPTEEWDGQPVYYKYVTMSTGPDTTTVSVNHSISNLENIIDAKIVTNRSGTGRRVWASSGGTGAYDMFTITDTQVQWLSTSNRSSWYPTNWYLKYTKTTD